MDWAVVIAFLGGLSGSVITAVSQYQNNKLNQKYELEKAQKLQQLELSFKEFELKNRLNEKLIENGEDPEDFPWEFHYMIHLKFLDFIKNNDIKDEQLDQKLIRFLDEIKHLKLTYKHFS